MNDSTALSRHALGVIEFDRVLEIVAGHAVSPLGAALVLASAPDRDIRRVGAILDRIEQVRAGIRSGHRWAVRSLPDLHTVLRRLAIPGTVLSAAELNDTRTLLLASRLSTSQFTAAATHEGMRTALAPLVSKLVSDAAAEERIARAIGDDGSVLDGASPLLRRLRRDVGDARQRTVSILERIAASMEPHHRVPDVNVTVRDGRYVIPIRREARNIVGGLVHDTSATGATLFVEPPAAVEHGNRVRELEAAERHEVERVLVELTESVRPLHERLLHALDALAELDSIHARALFGEAYGASPCSLAAAGSAFRIRDGRHPLLLAQGIDTVPFTLELSETERTLLISGPNTGGKTVLLKSVALICAMAQSGIPPTVGVESIVPVFETFFADVGDEQSIEASLSTFSAHLRNISAILLHASPASLVLVDEVGSGTDPVEGAALGGAILEELTRRGAITLATTHLGALQSLAAEVDGVVNGSLQFDSRRLQPTFAFIKGVPGRSFGLSIARRLGIPDHIVERAARRIPEDERKLSELITSIELRSRELAIRDAEVTALAETLERRGGELEAREQLFRTQRREFEVESRKGARRYLLDARESVERTIRELRAAAAGEVDDMARASRRHIEELASHQDAELRAIESSTRVDEPFRVKRASRGGRPLAVGDAVAIPGMGGREGRIMEIRGTDAVVAVGAVKLTVAVAALAPGTRGAEREPAPARGDLPDEHVSSEIDIRGMRVDEVDQALIPALDAAARADLKSLLIIHGKGTGALRSRVQETLARDPRVVSHRLGAWNEGGAGVTIVVLS